LQSAAAAVPLFSLASGHLLQAAESASQHMGDLIVREQSPPNLEMPLPGFRDYVTPNDLFFVRTHFETPRIDPRAWKLKIEGAVEKPIELGYEEIKAMPSKTVTATLECSGNGRGLLEPKKKGVQWIAGAVGNAKWTGVSVADILRRAGIKSNAVDIVFVGADRGQGKDGENLQFLRSIPVEKARDPDVLLAHEMNGQQLPVNHGFPLRAVVPGWFGVASVKWLERIVVSDKRFLSYFQSIDYSIWDRHGGIARMQPITEIQVKSIVAMPAAGESLAANQEVTVRGAAWSGDADVVKVEFSADGGTSWKQATLIDEPTKHAWRRWESRWRTPSRPGRVELLCRATDAAGNEQPTKRDDDRRNYMINHLVPVTVDIR